MSSLAAKQPGFVRLSQTMRAKPRGEPKAHALAIVVPPGPEALWPAIRAIGQDGLFTAADVARGLKTTEARVESYLRRLQSAGLVHPVGSSTEAALLWQLTTRRVSVPFLNAQGKDDFTHEIMSRVWRAFRMAKSLTMTGLLAALDDREFPTPHESVRNYVLGLALAGVLIEQEAEEECGEKQFCLPPSRIAASLPPRLYRVTFAYDPVQHSLVGKSAEAEEVRL